ncbi:Ig-like domain-containing protein [Candidatus Riflebacteria bacterium]
MVKIRLSVSFVAVFLFSAVFTMISSGCFSVDNSNNNNSSVVTGTTTTTGGTTVSGSAQLPATTVVAAIKNPAIRGVVNYSILKVYINGVYYGYLSTTGTFSFSNVPYATEYKIEIKNSADIVILVSIQASTVQTITTTTTAQALVLEQARLSNPSITVNDVSPTQSEVLSLVNLIETRLADSSALADPTTTSGKTIFATTEILSAKTNGANTVLTQSGTTTSTSSTSTTTTTTTTTSTTTSTTRSKPTATFAINNGDTTTTTRTVTLNLSNISKHFAMEMSVASGAYEALDMAKPYTLSGADGTKTISIVLKDSFGLTSDPITDSITLSTNFRVLSTSISDGTTVSQMPSSRYFPPIGVTFSEQLSASSVDTSSFYFTPAASSGSTAASMTIATFTPGSILASNTTYTVTLTTDIQDQYGNALANNYTFDLKSGPDPKIDAGDTHTLVLKTDGKVWAYGNNEFGQLGNGESGGGKEQTSPVLVKGVGGSCCLKEIKDISAGGAHSLALKIDGTVVAFGANTTGQLGDNSTTTRNTPVYVKNSDGSGNLSNIICISAGGAHSLALDASGTVWAFGLNDSGQLGDDSNSNRKLPVRLEQNGGANFTDSIIAISAGYAHSLILESDKTVWAFGNNSYGQLGANGTTNQDHPENIGGITSITGISAGGLHSLALKSDGTVYSWGQNFHGQLGRGTASTTLQYLTPGQVTNSSMGSNIGAISAGSFQSSALNTDGTVWCFGQNLGTSNIGKLGLGNVASTTAPTQMKGVGGSGVLGSIMAVSGGGSHTVLLRDSSFTVFGTGLNDKGQLGDSTTTSTDSPVQITIGSFTLY